MNTIFGKGHEPASVPLPSVFGKCRHLEDVEIEILPGREQISHDVAGRIHQQSVEATGCHQLGGQQVARPRVTEADLLGTLQAVLACRMPKPATSKAARNLNPGR